MLSVRNQMNEQERFHLGNHIAASLSNLERIAAVLPPQEVTSRGAGDVAVDRGLRLRMFEHLQDAESWLLEAPDA